MITAASHSWRSNHESHALELVVPPAETAFAYVHKRGEVFTWQAWRPFGGMFAYGEGSDLEEVKKLAEKAAGRAVFIEGVTDVAEEAPRVVAEPPAEKPRMRKPRG